MRKVGGGKSEKSRFLRPQLLTHQPQSVGECWIRLVVPRRPADGFCAPRHPLVCNERDQREEPQQRRSGPSNRPLRPMPLGFEAKTLTYFLESALHLPAHHENQEMICSGSAPRSVHSKAWGYRTLLQDHELIPNPAEESLEHHAAWGHQW